MRAGRTLLIAAMLLGCAGPRPDAPAGSALAMPAGWRHGAAPALEVDPAWWRGFGDPVMTALVDAALAHNADVAIALARLEEVRAQWDLAQAQRLPNLAGTLEGGRQESVSPFGRPQIQNPRQLQLALSYEADLFGRLAHASEAARAALLASEAARQAIRLSVAAAVAGGYINLRALDQRLALLQQTLDARADALRIARRRSTLGYTPVLEESQAESEYHSAAQLVPPTLLAIVRQEDALAVLLGEAPRALARGSAIDALQLPAVPGELPSALLRRRPDVVQAEQQLVAADSALDAARDAFMPSIRLSATGGYADSSLLANPVKLFFVGGSILAPLFDSGRLKAQAGAAAARRDQAAWAYRKATLAAMREVEDALAAVRRFAEQEQSLAAQRQAQASTLARAGKRYRAGYAPYLEQVDAQRGLLAAELGLVQSRSDRLLSMVALCQSLGGGWPGLASPPSRQGE